MDPGDLDSWRIFFRSSGVDIFVIIDKAIMVAAKDYASHLRLRRDQIVCLLYHHSCPCNELERSVPLEETHCRNWSEGNDHQDENRRVDGVDFNLSVEQDKLFMVELNGGMIEKQKDNNPTNADNDCSEETEAVEYVDMNGHQDKNRRVDDVDFNPSVEQDKFSTIECNDKNIQKRMDMPANVEGRCDKEMEAVENVDKNGEVERQGEDLLLAAVQHFGDSKSGSVSVANINEGGFMENLDVSIINNLEDGMLTDECGNPPEGLYQNTTESHLVGIDGPNMALTCDLDCEKCRGWKDFLNLGDDRTTEVLKIKSSIENYQNQSDKTLLESLMKLESMDLGFKILQVTLIGKAVNALRKHGSKEIRKVVRSLIRNWKTKADEWMSLHPEVEEVNPSAEDQVPLGLFIEGTTVAPLAPTLDETLQAFEGLNEEDFYSILPQDNALGYLYINEELNLPEEEQLQTNTIPGNNVSSESIRGEDLQQKLLPSQETSCQKDKQPSTDKNELAIFDDSTQVKKKDCATKLGYKSPLRRMPKGYENRKSEAKDGPSENAITKQRVSLQNHNVLKLKRSSGGPRRSKDESVDLRCNVASNSQLKPNRFPVDSYAATCEQRMERPSCSKRPENVRISQSSERQKADGTRRKPHKRCREAEDAVKKQHDIQKSHVNYDHISGGFKRHKHHHERSC